MADEFEDSDLLRGFTLGRRRCSRIWPDLGGLRGPAQTVRLLRTREHSHGVDQVSELVNIGILGRCPQN